MRKRLFFLHHIRKLGHLRHLLYIQLLIRLRVQLPLFNHRPRLVLFPNDPALRSVLDDGDPQLSGLPGRGAPGQLLLGVLGIIRDGSCPGPGALVGAGSDGSLGRGFGVLEQGFGLAFLHLGDVLGDDGSFADVKIVLVYVSVRDDGQFFLEFGFYGFSSHELEGIFGLELGHGHLLEEVLGLFLASKVGQELERTLHACFFINLVLFLDVLS